MIDDFITRPARVQKPSVGYQKRVVTGTRPTTTVTPTVQKITDYHQPTNNSQPTPTRPQPLVKNITSIINTEDDGRINVRFQPVTVSPVSTLPKTLAKTESAVTKNNFDTANYPQNNHQPIDFISVNNFESAQNDHRPQIQPIVQQSLHKIAPKVEMPKTSRQLATKPKKARKFRPLLKDAWLFTFGSVAGVSLFVAAQYLIPFDSSSVIAKYIDKPNQTAISQSTLSQSQASAKSAGTIVAGLSTIQSAKAPTKITIADIKVAGNIVPVNFSLDGSLNSPTEPNTVGWATQSSAPGGGKTVVLTGNHEAGKGVFADINNLIAGNEIQLLTAEGQNANYRVLTKEVLTRNNLTVPKLLGTDKNEYLKIVTNTGTKNANTGNYDQRLVISAIKLAN